MKHVAFRLTGETKMGEPQGRAALNLLLTTCNKTPMKPWQNPRLEQLAGTSQHHSGYMERYTYRTAHSSTSSIGGWLLGGSGPALAAMEVWNHIHSPIQNIASGAV